MDDARDRARLVRGAIMIPDIRANVAYAVEHGRLPRDAEGNRESGEIMRFLDNVLEDYPSLALGPLDLDFVTETRGLYRDAVTAIRARTAETEARIAETEARTAETEARTAAMEEQIQRMDAFIARMQTLVID